MRRAGRDDDAVVALVGEQLAQRVADRAAAADPPVDRDARRGGALLDRLLQLERAGRTSRGIGASSGSDIGTGAR